MYWQRLFWILPLLAIALVGCGSGEPDAGKTPEQVEQDAGGMDQGDLQKTVDEYKAKISEQQGKLEEIQKQIKDLPVTEMMSEKANELKQQVTKISDQIKELEAKLQVYLDQLAGK